MNKNIKTTLLSLAALGAVSAPIAGYAFAQGTQTQAQTGQNQTGQATDAETNDGPESNVKGNITLPAEAAGTETADNGQDAAKYQSLAKISAAEASAAAQKAVPGTVSSTTLGDENGSLVYEVVIGQVSVKVDAGNGQVLGQDAAGTEGVENGIETGD
ncbi:PepSY domain-containing protein [Deinococcus sp.]|uniref:PepSY domain-containing protein n=1 Tax=Deinococcus sp. TaxID=47478 RepID=UPI003B5B681D